MPYLNDFSTRWNFFVLLAPPKESNVTLTLRSLDSQRTVTVTILTHMINVNEIEKESKYELDLDDSIYDKTYYPSEKQIDQDEQPKEASTQMQHGQKKLKTEKARTSKKTTVIKKEVTLTWRCFNISNGIKRLSKTTNTN